MNKDKTGSKEEIREAIKRVSGEFKYFQKVEQELQESKKSESLTDEEKHLRKALNYLKRYIGRGEQKAERDIEDILEHIKTLSNAPKNKLEKVYKEIEVSGKQLVKNASRYTSTLRNSIKKILAEVQAAQKEDSGKQAKSKIRKEITETIEDVKQLEKWDQALLTGLKDAIKIELDQLPKRELGQNKAEAEDENTLQHELDLIQESRRTLEEIKKFLTKDEVWEKLDALEKSIKSGLTLEEASEFNRVFQKQREKSYNNLERIKNLKRNIRSLVSLNNEISRKLWSTVKELAEHGNGLDHKIHGIEEITKSMKKVGEVEGEKIKKEVDRIKKEIADRGRGPITAGDREKYGIESLRYITEYIPKIKQKLVDKVLDIEEGLDKAEEKIKEST